MQTYEDIAQLLERLSPPGAPTEFAVEWLRDECLAVGVDHLGRCALLIPGSAIKPRTEVVATAVREAAWRTVGGRLLSGSLVSLPSGDPFKTALAAIAAELLRRGIGNRLAQEVFDDVEPFIALVLRRILLPDSYLLGLIGELLVLRELLVARSASGQTLGDDPTSIWHGWRQESRDIVLGASSLEIKATGLSVSRHQISGFEQIEPRVIDQIATERLFIVSVGLRRAAGTSGFSVAALTEDILDLLRGSAVDPDDSQQKFLDVLASYGPEEFEGYRHAAMKEQEPYTVAYTTTFAPRVYDMDDANIRVIRRRDLAEQFSHVMQRGMSFTIELPDAIAGSIENPRTDLRTFLRQLAAATPPR